MTLTLELSDEQATTLQARAAAEGLFPEAWIEKPLRSIADYIVESMKDVPPQIMATMPTDAASQHDHYIYGWPKRDV